MCIEDGTYNLGVPVVEREITKLVISQEGQVDQKKIQLRARKIPLADIRKEALSKNKELLRIKDDAYYAQLSKDEAIDELKRINEGSNEDVEEMRVRLKIPAAKALASLA